MRVLFMQLITIQALARALAKKGIRVSFLPHEKYIIAAAFENTSKAQKYFPFFSPRTILAAWKNVISKHWSYPHKGPGRPPVSRDVKELVLKLKKENPLWGARRIRDELKKLSVTVSHKTVSKILGHFRKTGAIQPAFSWRKFLSSHWNSLFACDFFTTNLAIHFLRNQFAEFEYSHPYSALIHDNSGKLKWFPYSQYNFKDVNTVPYAPDMNAHAERFVRSVLNECLDHFVIFTHGQLRRLVKCYVEYYINYRSHQGLKGID